MIQTMRQYITAYCINEPISYKISREMIFCHEVDPILRVAMLRTLHRSLEQAHAASIRISDSRVLSDSVHELSGDWMAMVRHEPSSVNGDLAEWIIGKKVCEIQNGFVGKTRIPTNMLDRLVFDTLALKFCLVVVGNDVIVEMAIRHNPQAALVLV